MNPCEEYSALLDAYFDTECTPEESRAVEEHLRGCAACRAYLQDLEWLRGAFPDAEDVSVPNDFAAGVMEAVRAQPRKRPTPWKRALLPMAACFALLVLAIRLPMLQAGSAAPDPASASAIEPMMSFSASGAGDAADNSGGVDAADQTGQQDVMAFTTTEETLPELSMRQSTAATFKFDDAASGESWYAQVTLSAALVPEIPAGWTELSPTEEGQHRYSLTPDQLTALLQELGEPEPEVLDPDASYALVILQQAP